jgi:hypothetical protein
MGEPIIIWPPDGGNFSDSGDIYTSACQAELNTMLVQDCSGWYEANVGELGDSGLACCATGL